MVKHSEVVMTAQESQPVPVVVQPKKEKKKRVVEQDDSVFLTGMVDDQEMEDEEDEDVQIKSVNNDK